MPQDPTLSALVRKLARRFRLSDDDEAAILALPFAARKVEPGTFLIREGDEPAHCCFVLSGFCYRHKLTGEGERQIIAFHMAGDMVDLHNIFLDISDHNVQALTRSEFAFVPRRAIRELVEARPGVARAMWTETLVDASIFREWVLNVGRRSAISRIAHLLCELGLRLEAAGLAEARSYELPMTQEQIADAAGLTPVHVNRVLQQLGKLGLIDRSRRRVTIPDWERLRQIGDFNARYLHLEESARTDRAA
jgi:CRP-like cAMP-binding protein